MSTIEILYLAKTGSANAITKIERYRSFLVTGAVINRGEAVSLVAADEICDILLLLHKHRKMNAATAKRAITQQSSTKTVTAGRSAVSKGDIVGVENELIEGNGSIKKTKCANLPSPRRDSRERYCMPDETLELRCKQNEVVGIAHFETRNR